MADQLHKIVRGCQDHNPEAQRMLYDMFRNSMFGVCLRYAGNYDDAQDILQDGFIKVFEKINQFAFKGAFEGWIRRIMVNTALEKYRLHYRLVSIEDAGLSQEQETGHEISSDLEAADLIRIIQELSPRYRVVFNMYALEGYSHKEISAMLNISEGTSKSNLSRARAILQNKINNTYITKVQTL